MVDKQCLSFDPALDDLLINNLLSAKATNNFMTALARVGCEVFTNLFLTFCSSSMFAYSFQIHLARLHGRREVC